MKEAEGERRLEVLRRNGLKREREAQRCYEDEEMEGVVRKWGDGLGCRRMGVDKVERLEVVKL